MDHRYSVTLALATNPSRTKHQNEYAENAIQASLKAIHKNPGYMCIEAYIDDFEEETTKEKAK